MAARFAHASAPAGRRIAARLDTSPGGLVLAAAVPLLFLQQTYQPSVGVGVGSTTVTATLADFAVLVVVLVALATGVRDGWGALRDGRALWLAGIVFLVWVALEVLWGHHRSAAYAAGTHAVSALKFGEYLLLAPAIALLVRSRTDLLALLWSLVLWIVTATTLGLAQFLGANILLPHYTGGRTSSFIGWDDFGGLSTAILLVGLVALTLPRLGLGKRLAATAIVAGGLGAILAGALAAVLGLLVAAVVLAVVLHRNRPLERRRLLAAGAAVAVVCVGSIAIRGSDLKAFAHFLGAKQQPQTHVQTYSHRTLLAWIGWQIWTDHPLLGTGWLASAEPATFEPYLPAAHRRFPNLAPADFPSRAHPWGVQDAWIQAGADLGVVGFVLWLGTFAAAAWVAARKALRAPGIAPLLGLLAVSLLLGLWTAQSFFAGAPIVALTAVAFGLAATRTARA